MSLAHFGRASLSFLHYYHYSPNDHTAAQKIAAAKMGVLFFVSYLDYYPLPFALLKFKSTKRLLHKIDVKQETR